MTATAFASTPGANWLDAAEAAFAGAASPADMTPEACRAEIARLNRFDARKAARTMALLRRIDEAGLAKASGSTSTSAMISGDYGGDQATCARQVRAAQNLRSASLTEKALADGAITFEKASVIAATMAGLPESVDELTRVRVEKRLIADASRLSLPDLRRRVLRVADLYASRDQADIDENTTLRLREARAWQNTELWFGQARDGLVSFGGTLPEAQADLLKNQVGAIAAPRRKDDSEPDLTFHQRQGRAFCDWIERIPTDALLDQRLAKRLFTGAQRLAMADRDGGCTYPDCDRPPAWTEAHHIDHWAQHGGATDLDRGTLLCARHHHWVHTQNIDIRRHDGRTQFQVNGIWKTNHRWRP
jgi:hypothetical protein